MKAEIFEAVETIAVGEDTSRVIECAPIVLQLKNILVPLDFSEMSLKALRYATAFARQFGSKLTLVHVVRPYVYSPEVPVPPMHEQEYVEQSQDQLNSIRKNHVPADVATDVLLRQGMALDEILVAAKETNADVIMVSTHGYTGLKHLFLGSTAEQIVRKAPCPVFVVREVEHDFA